MNGSNLEVQDDKNLLPRRDGPVVTGSSADVIRYRVSKALRKVNAGKTFATEPIFIEAKEMMVIEKKYLRKYSKTCEKEHNFGYYTVIETRLEYLEHEKIDFIIKQRHNAHHYTEWYLCETFVLEPFLSEWWGVASRAQQGQAVVGQATTTILTGLRGNMKWKYD